jgi:predicted phosphoribosyltransferase
MFHDRVEAGRRLAEAVLRSVRKNAVVLALPRGGVPVAAEVARALDAPLDLLLVRKIGAPGNPELAVGAVAEGDPPSVVIDDETLGWSGEDAGYVRRAAVVELAEIERRRALYLEDAERVPVAGRTVILVDDGLATGTTVRAALQSLQARRPARIVVAVPVGAADTVAALRPQVDELICLYQPRMFGGVGAHYDDFRQVSDAEVVALLRARRRTWPPATPSGAGA